MKLLAYDFIVQHRPGKSNPADAPSRWPDYEQQKYAPEQSLIPTLHKKLGLVEEKLGKEPWAVEALGQVRSALVAIAARVDMDSPQDGVGKPTIERDRILSTRSDHLGGACEKQRLKCCNVAVLPLNPVAGTAVCRQLVPCALAQALATRKTAYGDDLSEPLKELIQKLQQGDAFAEARKDTLQRGSRRRPAGSQQAWSLDSEGALRFNNRLYVPAKEAMRAEIIQRHHDNALAGHFGPQKTTELVSRKFYWDCLTHDVKEYVNSCDSCQRTKPH